MKSVVPRSRSPLVVDQKEGMKVAFGRRLFQLMLAKNWNQSDLARASGLGRDAISTYIRGRSYPEPVSKKKLADALGVRPEDLDPPSGGINETAESGSPLFELRQSSTDPSKVHVYVNRVVTIGTAAKIIDLLKEEAP